MRRKVLLVVLPVFMAVSAVLFAVSANAESNVVLTKEQEQRISASCVSIKSSVNQLHASDALLRVNRGQMYESMASNLMEKFNSRLGNNDLDNSAMTTVTGSYRTALNTFRSDYILYEQKLSQALAIDCVTKPTQFYNTLQDARALRSTVHTDVKRLHELIDDYRSSVGDFLLNYERISQ